MTAITKRQTVPGSGESVVSVEPVTVPVLPDVASELQPALFSAYRDLAALRHDFPLLLVDGQTDDGAGVCTLGEIINDVVLATTAAGRDGDRQRSDILSLEAELRRMIADGEKGRLSALWRLASDRLLSRLAKPGRKALSETLERARAALAHDGELVGCDGELSGRFMKQVWLQVHATERQHFSAMIDDLIRRLTDILKADFSKSDEARSAWNVERAVGPTFRQVFDFEAMSRLLKDAPAHEPMAVARKERIGSVIAALRAQRFFAWGDEVGEGAYQHNEIPHDFVYDNCQSALRDFRDRLPEMVELIKSIAIAWLEIDNLYSAEEHDAMFARLDEGGIASGDLDIFPSFLINLDAGLDDPREKAAVLECLASNVRFKILVQTDDLFAVPALTGGSHPCGIQALPWAQMALGLPETFVLQSTASHLNRMRTGVVAGMESTGPALFFVYAGAKTLDSGARYLDAAAAVESRSFPLFTFNPAAGRDWARRFSLDGNPQCELDWPKHDFHYEDRDLQRQSESIAFSFADFAAGHDSQATFFRPVHEKDWHDDMHPLADCLTEGTARNPERSAYILMIDDNDQLYRVVVAQPVVEAALRCRDVWCGLQELGGVNNSHARAALKQAKAVQAAEPASKEEAAVPPPLAPETKAEAETKVDAAVVAVDFGPDPWIETPRCTTCNECTEINAQMFAYDDNMQASIADPDAGSYRQLVEAAESCQVCIIHPGQPRNPDEPGLEELLERAADFM
jgi:hypothetical protein